MSKIQKRSPGRVGLAVRLIQRIASEKARRARTPRRGTAFYNPGTGILLPFEEGNAAEIATVSVSPPLNTPIAGHLVTPLLEGAEITKNWPTVEGDLDTATSLGRELPQKQTQQEIFQKVFGNVGT